MLYNETKPILKIISYESIRAMESWKSLLSIKIRYQSSMKKKQPNNTYEIHKLTIHYGNQNVNNSRIHLLNELEVIYIKEIQYFGIL